MEILMFFYFFFIQRCLSGEHYSLQFTWANVNSAYNRWMACRLRVFHWRAYWWREFLVPKGGKRVVTPPPRPRLGKNSLCLHARTLLLSGERARNCAVTANFCANATKKREFVTKIEHWAREYAPENGDYSAFSLLIQRSEFHFGGLCALDPSRVNDWALRNFLRSLSTRGLVQKSSLRPSIDSGGSLGA
jgi:hypothetical protein